LKLLRTSYSNTCFFNAASSSLITRNFKNGSRGVGISSGRVCMSASVGRVSCFLFCLQEWRRCCGFSFIYDSTPFGAEGIDRVDGCLQVLFFIFEFVTGIEYAGGRWAFVSLNMHSFSFIFVCLRLDFSHRF